MIGEIIPESCIHLCEEPKFATGPGGGGGGGARKDKFLVPLNSLYDLYSMGKDGESVPPLTAAQSWYDVIMANDGGFVGLAKNF